MVVWTEREQYFGYIVSRHGDMIVEKEKADKTI